MVSEVEFVYVANIARVRTIQQILDQVTPTTTLVPVEEYQQVQKIVAKWVDRLSKIIQIDEEV